MLLRCSMAGQLWSTACKRTARHPLGRLILGTYETQSRDMSLITSRTQISRLVGCNGCVMGVFVGVFVGVVVVVAADGPFVLA